MKVHPDIWVAVLLGAFFFALYGLTLPESHSDAENAFNYAWKVENVPFHASLHRHHLLYLPLGKIAHKGAQAIGIQTRAYPVMVGLSVLAGAISVAFGYLLFRQRMGFAKEVAIFAAALMGVSYGFWRYACEAEIPVVAAAPLMISMYILTRHKIGILLVALGAAAAACATFIHIFAAIPAILAFPVLLMGRQRRASLLVYVLLVLAMIVAGYTAADTSPFAEPLTAHSGSGDVHLGIHGPTAIGNAAMGLGQALVSGNFLFCLQTFQDFMTRIFSHRMLREEIFMGQSANCIGAVLPFITLFLLAVVGLFVIDDRLGYRPDPENPAPTPATDTPTPLRTMALCSMLVWLILHSLVLLSYEPANPEGWVLSIIPLSIALILLWAKDARGIPPQALGTLFMLMLLHNYFGGMHLFAQRSSDYNHAKSQWILDHTRTKDTILTADNPAFYGYLRYHADADVLALRTTGLEDVRKAIQTTRHRGGNVLSTGNIFALPRNLRYKSPAVLERLAETSKALRPSFVPVANAVADNVWLYHPGH